MKDQATHRINQELRDRHPGPFGPQYWLLNVSGDIVVRGWEIVYRGDPEPIGKNLKICRTIREALDWIESHAKR
ncbi:hypothetical protein [Acidithiobacillus thiooxidans]|uniref:Uncharacterized protein n=1 Tax=Acidithiobacillus thiooxidans TaxID=930 RepID=A0A1C2J886_ACITH|nr:hypothetical protein [Acidithiobacillus thiooxidans]OCX70919.1 hypothetical protein A6M23_13265 [Acidithiobacillus thiooxidans]OCX84439.1 hypothetical protein A6P08_09115 [Acidithiobacillus thiooxidans]